MIYNLGINSAYVTNAATFQKMLNVFKSIITNKPISDADMPAFNAPYSQPILGKYPTARPYQFVYQEMDPQAANVANTGYATLWFKKEHPLYKDHFLYIGLRFTSTSRNNFAYLSLHIDIAELVTDDGTIINRVYGSNSAYSGYIGNVTPASSPTTVAHFQPVIGRLASWYFNLYTLNISDFGLGIFRCDMSASPLNAAFSHYIGTLSLETLAKPPTGDAEAKKLAFLPENYPMQALIFHNGSINGSAANNMVLGLIRVPNLVGNDVTLAGTALYSVLESPIYRQPTSATQINYGNTLGGTINAMEVVNVNGEKASELYPEYLRNPYNGTPLAKLPILRPLQGNADYAHYGRTITLNDTENYIGIQALEDWDPNLSNIASNTYLQALKALPYRQAYLRMD